MVVETFMMKYFLKWFGTIFLIIAQF